jgi:phenylacetate-CoA ligase
VGIIPVATVCGKIMSTPHFFIPDEETLDRDGIESLQRRKLAAMLTQVLSTNPFYRHKLATVDFNPLTDPIDALPFTTRAELEQNQRDHPPYGTNLTCPFGQYFRFHQTSGSGGSPLRWLDNQQGWDWFKKCWAINFAAAGITKSDRLIFPFSFGPFVGFWGAFEGATNLGYLSIPAGGLTTMARLRLILENHATIVFCTPTYALRLAEVAAEEGLDLASSAVRAFIVAGEPGGNIPATRNRIESAWNARVFDHTGMTEMGPTGIECAQNPGGVHILESEFIAEVINPQTLHAVADGELGELVLTNLGRTASPLIRYRTGDQVRPWRGLCRCGRHWMRLEGGILGRVDDMFIVRGNNVFPSAIESIIRQYPEVAEFRVEAYDDGALTHLTIDLELCAGADDSPEIKERVVRQVQDRLSFRALVRTVPPGSLPRFEMKARRFVRRSAREPQQNQSSK